MSINALMVQFSYRLNKVDQDVAEGCQAWMPYVEYLRMIFFN